MVPVGSGKRVVNRPAEPRRSGSTCQAKSNRSTWRPEGLRARIGLRGRFLHCRPYVFAAPTRRSGDRLASAGAIDPWSGKPAWPPGGIRGLSALGTPARIPDWLILHSARSSRPLPQGLERHRKGRQARREPQGELSSQLPLIRWTSAMLPALPVAWQCPQRVERRHGRLASAEPDHLVSSQKPFSYNTPCVF